MKQQKWWVLLGCILLLQGCGVKFWYNRMDWVVPWYVDDYVELSNQQESRLEKLVLVKTEWHRKNELPKYIQWLEELEGDIRKEDIEPYFDQHNEQVRHFFNTLLSEVGVEIAALMTDLSDQQVQELLKTLKENDQEILDNFREESAEERLDDRYDNIKESLGDWVGRLTKEQKAIAKRWANEIRSTLEARMEYRDHWRSELEKVLSKRATENGEALIKDFFKNFTRYRTDELNVMYEHNRQLNRRYLIQLHQTMTKKQRKRLLERLNNYKEDFIDLLDDD